MKSTVLCFAYDNDSMSMFNYRSNCMIQLLRILKDFDFSESDAKKLIYV